MSFQVIVREIKPRATTAADANSASSAPNTVSEQIYEQQVPDLDLSRVLAAVNYKPRTRKPRTVKPTT